MNGRKRTVQIKFRVTEAERDLILEKMKLIPTDNMAAYLRKIAIDGYIIQVDHTDIKAMTAEIQKIGVNVNQIAKRANAVAAVVSAVPVQRARGSDVADVVRVGRYKPHPKKNAGRYRRGVIPLFCCSAANRSLSCFLHFAVMFFTFITCRVHSAHCSEEISSFSKESSIRKRTVLHSVSAFFCS